MHISFDFQRKTSKNQRGAHRRPSRLQLRRRLFIFGKATNNFCIIPIADSRNYTFKIKKHKRATFNRRQFKCPRVQIIPSKTLFQMRATQNYYSDRLKAPLFASPNKNKKGAPQFILMHNRKKKLKPHRINYYVQHVRTPSERIKVKRHDTSRFFTMIIRQWRRLSEINRKRIIGMLIRLLQL